MIMKKVSWLLLGTVILVFSGCTRIVKMEPTSGPPGTPVFLEAAGIWGDPAGCTLKFDNKEICAPFHGSFTVPDDCRPGKHIVTLVDKVDWSEVNLIFPLLRWREGYAIFTVEDYGVGSEVDLATENAVSSR